MTNDTCSRQRLGLHSISRPEPSPAGLIQGNVKGIFCARPCQTCVKLRAHKLTHLHALRMKKYSLGSNTQYLIYLAFAEGHEAIQSIPPDM